MTDNEISKALALAIGWPRVEVYGVGCMVRETTGSKCAWKDFDYRDWNVISPIAERYNAFPYKMTGYWEVSMPSLDYAEDTPQKAIAMAVIGWHRDARV